jgi:hypothetical protein
MSCLVRTSGALATAGPALIASVRDTLNIEPCATTRRVSPVAAYARRARVASAS